MSAFIISAACMDRVVSGICIREHGEPIVGRCFLGFDTRDCETPTKIGRTLYALNIEAVKQRYSNSRDDVKEAVLQASHFADDYKSSLYYYLTVKNTCIVDSYKALCCLIYQCSEGGALETTPTYKALELAQKRLAGAIIGALPAYKSAKWA